VKRWIGVAVVLGLTVIAAGALWVTARSDGTVIPTVRPHRGAVQVLVHARGDLRAVRSVPLMVPPIGGPVTIVDLVPSGGAVKAGDIIVAFDPSEQEFALEQATFDLQLAEQELLKAEAEAAAQAADDDVAMLKARFEARRAELDASTNELVGAVLAAQHKLLFDEARERLAQLDVDVTSRREAATASRAVLRERRMKAQVAVDVARRNIQNLQIRAPFDGFVTLRMNMMAFRGVVFSGSVMPE
jgi:HlyD family secretion protein